MFAVQTTRHHPRQPLFMRPCRDDEWNSVINVNLTATFRKLCNRRACAAMMKARWGRIVNISRACRLPPANPGQATSAAPRPVCGQIVEKSLAYDGRQPRDHVNAVPRFHHHGKTDKLTDDQKAGIHGADPCRSHGRSIRKSHRLSSIVGQP